AFPFLVTLIHGDADDFAPIEVARAIADITLAPARLIEVQGGDHCLNDLPPAQVLSWLETAIDPKSGLRQVVPASPPASATSPGPAPGLGRGAAAAVLPAAPAPAPHHQSA